MSRREEVKAEMEHGVLKKTFREKQNILYIRVVWFCKSKFVNIYETSE